MSRQALRVLAVGYQLLEEVPKELTSDTLETGLTLLGLVGMIDPPRPEAKAAVAKIRTGSPPLSPVPPGIYGFVCSGFLGFLISSQYRRAACSVLLGPK